MDFVITIVRASQFSSLLPLIFGLVYYKNLNKPFKRLVWFFALCVFMEFCAKLVAGLTGNNMPLLHFYSLIEFAMFTYIFKEFFKIKAIKYYLLIILFVFIGLIDVIFLNSIYNFNSIKRSLMCIVLIIASLYFYYSNIKSNQSIVLYTQPMYWFSTGVIIYFSINFFTFMMMSFFQTSYPSIVTIASNVHSCVNILSNSLFAVSFVSFKWNR